MCENVEMCLFFLWMSACVNVCDDVILVMMLTSSMMIGFAGFSVVCGRILSEWSRMPPFSSLFMNISNLS